MHTASTGSTTHCSTLALCQASIITKASVASLPISTKLVV